MKPTKNNVLIERIPGSKETSSGLILKSSLEPDRGKVEAIGPDVTEISVGEEVFLDWNKTTKVDDRKYIISVENIVFVY